MFLERIENLSSRDVSQLSGQYLDRLVLTPLIEQGNGHFGMLEKNSDEIARYFEGWIRQNVR